MPPIMLNTLRPGRLQVKLLLLVFIASLPAFVLLFWLGLNARADAIGYASAQLASTAHLARLDQEKRLEAAQQIVKFLARFPILRGGNVKACESLLADLKSRQSIFYNVGVFNIDGSLRCSALPLPAAATVADQQWFRRALDTQQFTVSGHIFNHLSELHSLQFAVPLYDLSDSLNGVVFASWELVSHEKSLSDLKLESGTRLTVADRSGIVLASYPGNPGAIGQLLPDQRVLDAIRTGAVGSIGNEGSAPILSSVTAVAVGDTIAMYTLARMDEAVVVAPINRRALLNFAVWLTTLAVALAVAWRLGGRWVSRRAASVSAVAQQIGAGKPGARTAFNSSPDELDQIGVAIDRMADSLEHRETDLRVINKRLSEAQRIAKLGHWEFDVASHRGWWSPETAEMFSMSTADTSFDAFLEWVHADDRKQVAAAYASIEATGTPIDIEYRAVGFDGKLRWIHAVAECVREGDGRPAKIGGIIQDITERRSAAAALITSEERYRQLFNANPLPIVMYDATTLSYIAVNDAFCHQYGYGAAELKDKRITDIHVSKSFEVLCAEIRELPMGISTVKDVRHVKRNGTIIDVEVTRIRADIDGKPMVISSPLDVTEKVRAEHALKASEERYRQLFESNPLPLWVYDPETLQFLDVNEVACEHYGYSRQEFMAMTIRDIRPPQDIERLEHSVRDDGESVVGSGPWHHRRKDGSVIVVEINGHEILLHGRRARLVCPIDVTEKVYAQEQIRRMNLLLERKVEMRTEELSRSLALRQSLFDNVPQIVWLADLNGAITFANRVWAETIGTAPDDWQGAGWSKALHPDDLERVTRAWQQAAPSETLFAIEYRLLHRDGGYHAYQVNARKVFARNGDPICWVGICSDVTDSHRREDALRFANQELEAFSYSVSHDLRAPLRAISGFSERLQIESAGRLDEQGRHCLDRIRAGAANMNELIDDLLSLSQVSRGDMAMGMVDLTLLARQVFDELRQLEPDHPAEIVIRENMSARGDPRLLQILFVNLIGNALKFSGKREVSRIEVGETVRTDGTSTFFVRDNGAGFDPAYASKIFGVFQRLHSVAEFPGTGIGLATVQRIVHRHGGIVSAEGALDKGTTIYFSLRRD